MHKAKSYAHRNCQLDITHPVTTAVAAAAMPDVQPPGKHNNRMLARSKAVCLSSEESCNGVGLYSPRHVRPWHTMVHQKPSSHSSRLCFLLLDPPAAPAPCTNMNPRSWSATTLQAARSSKQYSCTQHDVDMDMVVLRHLQIGW